MFIALPSLVIPLRQERHVTEHAKAHCAPLERGRNSKHEAINIGAKTRAELKCLLVQCRTNVTVALRFWPCQTSAGAE